MMKVQIVILRERCGDGSSKSPERLSNSSLLFEDSRAGDYGVELSSTLCFTSKTRAKKSFIGVRLGYFRTSFFPLRERNNKDDFTRNLRIRHGAESTARNSFGVNQLSTE